MKKDTSTPTPADVKSVLTDLDAFLNLYLVKKAPSLPDNIKEIIVKIAPYCNIILLIVTFFTVESLFWASNFVNRFSYVYGTSITPSFSFSFVGLILIISGILYAIALPGLFKRKISGWNFMFYGEMVNLVYMLLRIEIFSFIISAVIGLYFLYQIKSYYKN